MKLTEKKQRWVPHDEVLPQSGGAGVTRRILAYNDGLMQRHTGGDNRGIHRR